MIMPASLLREDRIKVFGIEIEKIDLVPRRFQTGERSSENAA
jgi:hypothetical protein